MQKFIDELACFPERESTLRKINRYSLYHTMWYRTNLWTHTRRVAWIVEELAPLALEVFGNDFDPEKAEVLALVHDDAEMVIGDIQAGNKEKMTKEQLKSLDVLEKEAAGKLAKETTYIGKYEYRELLHEAVDKDSLESMVVDWADKYDGFCEALHEIFAGHELWTTNVVNEYGTISLPTDHYMNYFLSFRDKIPKSAPLFDKKHPMFQVPKQPKVKELIVNRKPHTVESLNQRTGYEPYDLWVNLTLAKGSAEDIANLHIKKE